MLPKISNSEWEVMKIIWSKQNITASEIIKELNSKSTWAPSTIKSLINRLLNKNAISFKKVSKEYFYYALVSEKESIKEESKSFIDRVFNGSFNSMFVNLVKSETLTDIEIEELKQILNMPNDRGEL